MNWVWLAIRLTGIALGIITLLGFASGYLGVEFKPYFKNVLDWLEIHLVDFIVRPEEIEWALDYLRQHFAWVPKPEPHWKPIYTLSALLMLSVARRTSWFMIPIASLCSLVPAIFAGGMPLSSLALVMWPIAGFFAFVAADLVLHLDDWGSPPLVAAGATFFAAAGYFVGTIVEVSGLLVFLAALVGVLGLLFLWVGLQSDEGTFLQRLQQREAALGLDITATLGGAVALGYLFAA